MSERPTVENLPEGEVKITWPNGHILILSKDEGECLSCQDMLRSFAANLHKPMFGFHTYCLSGHEWDFTEEFPEQGPKLPPSDQPTEPPRAYGGYWLQPTTGMV